MIERTVAASILLEEEDEEQEDKGDQEEESLERIGQLIQELFRSGKVHASLAALNLDLDKDY
jgi:hypothetical protein